MESGEEIPLRSVERLKAEVEPFVFFHLGADARLAVDPREGGVQVEIEHKRVRTIRFQLSAERLEAFEGDSEAFEEFMLEQLTRHRVHR